MIDPVAAGAVIDRVGGADAGRDGQQGRAEMLNSKQICRVAAIIGLTLAGTGASLASPSTGSSSGSGVTGPPLVTANLLASVHFNNDRIKFQTKDATDVRVQKLVFAPGAYSAWHHHPGLVIVAVEIGTVTLTDSRCGAVTYGVGQAAGSVFVEGHHDPQRASSTGGATVHVTYVVPAGSAFAITDAAPLCATQF